MDACYECTKRDCTPSPSSLCGNSSGRRWWAHRIAGPCRRCADSQILGQIPIRPNHFAGSIGELPCALDLGGGIEFLPTDRTFVRVDVGNRAVRYPAPALDGDGTVREDGFFGHDFRFQIGGGFQF